MNQDRPTRRGSAPWRWACLALALWMPALDAAAQERPADMATRLLVRRAPPDARQPIRLASLQFQAEIVGQVAKSRVELVLHNPNARELEGELQFPLLDGQSVSGFALDINGKLRTAVPVPKDKGRQVFDDVTRQRVDPALLQVTQGNNYSLRVYPIPAHGTRRVMLELTQALRAGDNGGSVYRLPLAFAGNAGALHGQVRMVGVADPRQAQAALGAMPLKARADGSGNAVLEVDQQGDGQAGVLLVRLPAPNAPVLASTEHFRGKTYFYAEVPAGAQAVPAPAAQPRHLGIVWDASASAQRDIGKELRLLEAYFQRLGRVDVTLRVVRDTAEPDLRFSVQEGRWDALKTQLLRVVYDGATHAALLGSVPEGVDQALLFSDGLVNYGAPPTHAPEVPTTAISSAVSADSAALRRVAERSGGAFVDLQHSSVDAALRQLTQRRPHVVGLQSDDAVDLIAVPVAEQGRFRIAGVLSQPQANIGITIDDGRGRRQVQWVKVAALPQGQRQAVAVAAQQWAGLKLQELSADELKHARAIERLGTHFRMLTPRTSLIVLDAAQDYARYGIEPPEDEPELVADVDRLSGARQAQEREERARQLARVTREFEARVAWWNKDFPKDAPPRPPERKAEASMAGMASESARAARPMAPPPVPAPAMAAAPMALADNAPAMAKAQRSEAGGEAPATIALKKWQPDSPYARRMRAAMADEVYAVYLDERGSYRNSTAFFLDAADILLEKKQPALAARVVSNLAEMNLENRHILRILAYRLMQMDQHALAVPMLERVLALAPDEPQSWRDLGLARAVLGQRQRAVEDLWHVVCTPWHGRFPGIELIALTELNAIVAQAEAAHQALDTTAIPPALLKNLPVGLRVVLSWDADNTDIDLWVTDPNAEPAYFGHRLTHQGGAMSMDLTGGYGPEEFSLKAPKPGTYKVQANFYGHRQQVVAPATTLMLQLFTDFGTPRQKMEQVILRLSGAGEKVDVGEFVVGGGMRPVP